MKGLFLIIFICSAQGCLFFGGDTTIAVTKDGGEQDKAGQDLGPLKDAGGPAEDMGDTSLSPDLPSVDMSDMKRVCDQANDCNVNTLDDNSCATQTSDSPLGTLSCASDCTFDTSACYGYKQVSAGVDYLCALKNDGHVDCWGAGFVDPDVYSAISVGGYMCGLKAGSGVAKCWGGGAPTAPERQFRSISVGEKHVCGTIQGGRSNRCFGGGGTAIVIPPKYGSISSGDGFSCGIERSNKVPFCFPRTSKIPSNPVKKIDAGLDFVCVLKNDGTIGCFKPFAATDILSLTASGGAKFDDLSAGGSQSVCGLYKNGGVKCTGIMGNPDPGLTFSQISVGKEYACGITKAHDIRCWGDKVPADFPRPL